MNSQLGPILVEKGLLTDEQLLNAQQECELSGRLLPTCIVEIGMLSEKILYETLCQHFNIPYEDIRGQSIDETALKIIPHELAVKHSVLPLKLDGDKLKLAVADPSDTNGLNELKFIANCNLDIVLTSELSIRLGQERMYNKAVHYGRIIDSIKVEALKEEAEAKQKPPKIEKAEDAPIIQLADAILSDAIRKNASDIHIEPYENFFRVRFRIDGVLHEIMRPPPKLKSALISRIKVMASLDVAERRLPQDGRIKIHLSSGVSMDFRVNVIPTLFGEKMVLRLLDKSNLQLDMTKLGFEAEQLADFVDSITKTYGMVLVTGPTGSGKTTTLYSALSELNKVAVNVFTAEDPVEFNLPGINQVQVHEDIGFDFTAALRAFLRQDPDVIMVGEIRDTATAEIAIKASLTGHLVLSTLHTNDAPSTIGRLLNMGVEPFLVASSINLILAQRLARKNCSHCRKEVVLPAEVLEDLNITQEEAFECMFQKGQGCLKCGNTGYSGRIAIYEVMPMYEEIREMVLQRASATEIKQRASQLGMLTLRASAVNRLKQGVTSLEEVYRVTDS
ncbi:MAG: type IV-A pilus assembly ATPase PilB [Deltaproteobacteria bacterium]|nr:type IV-A pilus assembly ATPase PilB [Deltaproteobacteria bacterium]